MKAMYTAFAAIIVIALLAYFGLNALPYSTAEQASAGYSVRLSEDNKEPRAVAE